MVTLTPMSDDAFAEWAPGMWADYRADLIRAGSSEAAADENVARNQATTMPDGRLAPDQHVFDVREGDETVGVVWLAQRDTEWFVYNLEIAEGFRGRGLGRQALQAAERLARESGGTTIGLSVFGFNDVAQRLYASEGYQTVQTAMTKRLV